jgi:hypothetical protein
MRYAQRRCEYARRFFSLLRQRERALIRFSDIDDITLPLILILPLLMRLRFRRHISSSLSPSMISIDFRRRRHYVFSSRHLFSYWPFRFFRHSCHYSDFQSAMLRRFSALTLRHAIAYALRHGWPEPATLDAIELPADDCCYAFMPFSRFSKR